MSDALPPPEPAAAAPRVPPAGVPGLPGLMAIVVAVVVVAALYLDLAREVLIPVTLAMLLSFVLGPLVDLLRRAWLGRVPSVLLAVLLALGIILALGTAIGTQVAQLAVDIPRYQATIEKKVADLRDATVERLSAGGRLFRSVVSHGTDARQQASRRALRRLPDRRAAFRSCPRGAPAAEEHDMISASAITFPAGHEPPDLSSGSILFIGNATVLLRYAGFTVLTDPTFIHMHEQVPLGYGLHTTRLTNPAVEIHELPPLDFVVLSHFHGDHFDQVAERELNKALPIVTTPTAAKELRERGFGNLHPLQQWGALTAQKGDARLRITATPGRHGPPLSDLVMPEVMGSLWEFQSPADTTLFRMYVTGDTLVIDDLKELPRRYPDINLALLHLGGTRVLGVMVTMDGKQGVEMVRLVNPKRAIPIHYNDYDVFKSPLSDFQREVEAAGLQDRVHYLSHGETYTFNIAPSRIRR